MNLANAHLFQTYLEKNYFHYYARGDLIALKKVYKRLLDVNWLV